MSTEVATAPSAVDGLIVRTERPLNAETSPHVLCRSPMTPVPAFFVRTHGDVPEIGAEAYRLTVEGRVRSRLVLGLADLRTRFPRVSVSATLACAGNRRAELGAIPDAVPWGPGAIGTAIWTGARISDVLQAAGIVPGARDVAFTGADVVRGEHFGGSIPLTAALQPDVLLADEMNGEPLTAAHGFPVRAIVPGYIGARNVKWLTRLSVQQEPSPSFFQRRDYLVDGRPLGALPVTSAICRPADGAAVPAGTIRIEGYALGTGGQPVDRVELSRDGGRTWRTAVVRDGGSRGTWLLWHLDADLPSGSVEIAVRATDASGTRQPEHVSLTGNPRGYANNGWHRIRVVAVPQAGE